MPRGIPRGVPELYTTQAGVTVTGRRTWSDTRIADMSDAYLRNASARARNHYYDAVLHRQLMGQGYRELSWDEWAAIQAAELQQRGLPVSVKAAYAPWGALL